MSKVVTGAQFAGYSVTVRSTGVRYTLSWLIPIGKSDDLTALRGGLSVSWKGEHDSQVRLLTQAAYDMVIKSVKDPDTGEIMAWNLTLRLNQEDIDKGAVLLAEAKASGRAAPTGTLTIEQTQMSAGL